MTSCGKKAATAGDHGINACQIPLQVAKLLLNGLADLVNPWPLLLGNSKKLLPHFSAVCARLMAKIFLDLIMHGMDQDLDHLSCFIEQRQIRWMTDFDRSAGGVNQQ
jgi:hypothetical protein